MITIRKGIAQDTLFYLMISTFTMAVLIVVGAYFFVSGKGEGYCKIAEANFCNHWADHAVEMNMADINKAHLDHEWNIAPKYKETCTDPRPTKTRCEFIGYKVNQDV